MMMEERVQTFALILSQNGARPVSQKAIDHYSVVLGQVTKLKNAGGSEVAFRVAVKDGKVSFTARALKGVDE